MALPRDPPVGTVSSGLYYGLDQFVAARGRVMSGVRAGCAVTASGTPSLTLQVSSGDFSQAAIDGLPNRTYAGGTVTLSAAHANFTRVDLISIYWNGTAGVVVATPGTVLDNSAPSPVLETPRNNEGSTGYNIVLATVVVYPGATAITNEEIYDRRFLIGVSHSGPSDVVAAAGATSFTDGEGAKWMVFGGGVGPGVLIGTGSPAGTVVGTAASVDSEVALFSGTTGKLLKRATGTGIARVASGVQSAAELSGDVTTSGSNVVTIANDAVTYAKQQNVSAASRLLGRGSASGAGDCEEISLGTNLSMSGTTLNATGGSSADTLGVLASDATSTNSTLAALTGVSVATAANSTEVWQVDLQLILVNGSGGTTADWKFGWAVPAGMTGFWGSNSNVLAQDDWGSVVTSSTPSALLTEAQNKVFGGANTGVQGLHIWGTFYSGGTAGTLQLQFAQNTTNAAAQTVKRGSGGIFRKMLT